MATKKTQEDELKSNEEFLKTMQSFSDEKKEGSVEAEVQKKYTQIAVASDAQTKSEWKSFFAKYGLSLSSGIAIAVDFLQEKVKRGDVKLKKSGIIELN